MVSNNPNSASQGGQAQSLAGQVIVIIGGTGSIGGALAASFIDEARGVVIFGRRAKDAAIVSRYSGKNNFLAVAGDMTIPKDIDALVEQTVMRFGRIDTLINAAGKFARGPFIEMRMEEWQKALMTNVMGFAYAARAVLPYMVQQGFGRIVNITTRLAANPGPQTSAYSCSKAAAHVLMKCLALEVAALGQKNILVNDLVPGPTKNRGNPNGQDPALVVPFVRQLLLLPPGGPSGKTYFRGKLYNLFDAGS